MVTWEYETVELRPGFWSSRVEAAHLRDALQGRGARGWELVSILSATPAGAGLTGPVLLVFKRPAHPAGSDGEDGGEEEGTRGADLA